MLTLAQDTVTHDKTELYAVIGALVAVIGILKRDNWRLIGIIVKMQKDEKDSDKEAA